MIHRAYVAGFFDGEGCVNITTVGKNRQVTLRLQIVNTNVDLLRLLQVQYGGCLGKFKVPNHWKQAWSLSITAKEDIRKFINDIIKYSVLKLPQLKLAIEFLDFMAMSKQKRCDVHRTPTKRAPWHITMRRSEETMRKELEFKDRLHEMNHRGVRPN